MERKSVDSQGYKVESQIRADFGRVAYELECHNREIRQLNSRIVTLRLTEAIISAVTVTCFVIYQISALKVYTIIGTCSAIVLMMFLILNAYTNGYNLMEIRQEHQHSSDLIYSIKEDYINLITDLDLMDIKEVLQAREKLQCRLYEVTKNAPKVSAKVKADARQSLNEKRDIVFSDAAIDNMLPEWVRRTKTTKTVKKEEPIKSPANLEDTDEIPVANVEPTAKPIEEIPEDN